MVSRHRARTGELVDAETSKNVLRNSVSHKQKASWTQVDVTVHEHGDACLEGKIYYSFDRRTAAKEKFENKSIRRWKEKNLT
jgi:IS5 family transposase